MKKIHFEIKISPDFAARLLKKRICSICCEIDQFFNNVFQFVRNKNAFCMMIEFKFAKTGKIIIPEDSQSQWVYN